jgi:hypothetical protein
MLSDFQLHNIRKILLTDVEVSGLGIQFLDGQ